MLREELQTLVPLGELQAAHAAALERLFADWEGRWRECRECLPEVIPAVQHLWEKNESICAGLLTNRGFETGRRIGELEIALRIVQQREALCLELGSRRDLAYCYWQWSLLARKQRDRKTEREKLAAALDIFTELNMARERDAVRAELEKAAS